MIFLLYRQPNYNWYHRRTLKSTTMFMAPLIAILTNHLSNLHPTLSTGVLCVASAKSSTLYTALGISGQPKVQTILRTFQVQNTHINWVLSHCHVRPSVGSFFWKSSRCLHWLTGLRLKGKVNMWRNALLIYSGHKPQLELTLRCNWCRFCFITSQCTLKRRRERGRLPRVRATINFLLRHCRDIRLSPLSIDSIGSEVNYYVKQNDQAENKIAF